MSDETISIGELEAKRAAMTFGVDATSDGGGLVDADGDEIGVLEMSRDAEGLLAEHNAMPALIAIAKAALELREAERAMDRANRVDGVRFQLVEPEDVRDHARDNLKRCWGAYHDALSKVRP